MLTDDQIKQQIKNTLDETDFKLGKKYTGKVRDNYISPEKRIMITSDRISCFDSVIGTIPFKGQVLNQIAEFWFEQTKDLAANHILDTPDPNVLVVKECQPMPVEVIIRGYITGSLWRDYEKGTRELYGLTFDEGLIKNQKFPKPIITPSTKAEHGAHDMPISKAEIIEQGLVDEEIYEQMEEISLLLFQRGTELLEKNNLILVDTKYEFGLHKGKLILMDEIHTPDSSRFWFKDTYDANFKDGKNPKQLDKEYVRQWLIKERNYMGDGPIPELTEEVVVEAAKRYIQAYELITGKTFEAKVEPVLSRVTNNLKKKGYVK